MELRSGNRKLDPYRPTFDPHLDIATLVFSHVQCVRTRLNLALVSKLWREASKPAAAYPLWFDFDAFRHHGDEDIPRPSRVISLLDNDEALSLPYERVVGLLGDVGLPGANYVCSYAACLGSVRLLKWVRENNLEWGTDTCYYAAADGHLSALKYLHENGCPWDRYTCHSAAAYKHWDCLQYAVDNKCDLWEKYAKKHAEHLR